MNSSMPPSLATLLGGSRGAPSPDRRGLPEAQAMRLRELVDVYARPNPFERGDLVTPRVGANLRGAGDLHVVLEVIPRITPSFRSDSCCAECRFDMRIARTDRGGDEAMAWVESFRMEPWTPSGAAERAPSMASTAEDAPV